MTDKVFRVGVVGCGRIAVVYSAAFRQLPSIRVMFAVDKDIKRAEAFAEQFPGCGFSDRLEDLLKEELDAVHILTPHFLHKEQAIACLKAGFHVLTEKPIAITLADAAAMSAAERESGKQLGVIYQNRYIEGIAHAKELIGAGKLGKLTGAWSTLNWWRPPSYYECDWKGLWDKEGGGVVIDQAIHSIDLVRYLMGCEVASIQGHYDRRVLTSIEVEDVADAVITFENGAAYSFFACNYYVTNSPIRVEVSGEKGSVLLTESTVEVHLAGEAPYTVLPEQSQETGGENYWGRYHQIQIQDFYDCLAQGKPVPMRPEDATKTLEIVLGIYESSRQGRKLTIEEVRQCR